jgi:site-specific DNA-methyltransferase (adenine-specific)
MIRKNNNILVHADSREYIKTLPPNSVDLILSDIPYGISFDEWDVLHSNTNKALLGSSPAQVKAGNVFKTRGKPLNGWSEADKKIPIEYYNWCMSWAKDWLNCLKPGSSVFIFAGRRFSHRCICAMEDSGFIFKDMIGWNKKQAVYRAQHIDIIYKRRNDYVNEKKWKNWRVGNLRPVFEPILWFMKPYKTGGTLADNVAEYNLGAINDCIWNNYASNSENFITTDNKKSDHGLHPTQKPLDLMKALIELTTIENQIVCDPFCGSGSTLLAAKELNRHFIGVEKNSEYFQVACQRLGFTDK